MQCTGNLQECQVTGFLQTGMCRKFNFFFLCICLDFVPYFPHLLQLTKTGKLACGNFYLFHLTEALFKIQFYSLE